MLRRYPLTLRWRQGLPPLFVLSLAGLGLLGLLWPGFWLLLAGEMVLYLLALTAAAVQSAFRRKKVFLVFGLPLAIFIMHICWGSGFLWSMIKGLSTKQNAEKK
jgi:hypothetical protein